MLGLLPWRRRTQATQPASASTEPAPVATLRDELEEALDRVFEAFRLPALFDRGWGCEVQDLGSEVVVRMDAPGFEPDEFDVRVSGNVLTVRARHQEERGGEQAGYYHRASTLRRSITLPPGVDPNQAEAVYRRGVLEVRLKKQSEELRGRKVPVKAV
jgi:HSP20 family protein